MCVYIYGCLPGSSLVKIGVCVYIYIVCVCVYIYMCVCVCVSACNAGDQGLIPRSGGSPGEANGNPLQYSCLENSLDRGAWCAAVYGSPRVGND